MHFTAASAGVMEGHTETHKGLNYAWMICMYVYVREKKNQSFFLSLQCTAKVFDAVSLVSSVKQ